VTPTRLPDFERSRFSIRCHFLWQSGRNAAGNVGVSSSWYENKQGQESDAEGELRAIASVFEPALLTCICGCAGQLSR
jgi:hypothetical protein